MTSSGRLSQYKILRSDRLLTKHLSETELLTIQTLQSFLAIYNAIVIKPVYGPGEINVIVKSKKYMILTDSDKITFTSPEEIYSYLIENELKQPFHIIQAKKPPTHFLKSPFHYFVTLHRQTPSAEWKVVEKVEKYRSLLKQFLYLCLLRKIETIAKLAARKLGDSFPDCHTIAIELIYDLRGGIWIYDTILHFPKSKWSQFHTLTAMNTLIPHVPETNLLTQVSFEDFIQKYKDIIIKPCTGKEGNGVVQITANEHLSYQIHSGRKTVTISSFEETFDYIKKKYLSKAYYLVQKKLPLATVNDCPMDIRVIAQKSESSWFITGKLVKVAGSGFIITNAAQKLLTFEEAIQSSNISHLNRTELQSQIDQVCIEAAHRLEDNHSNQHIFGFDIGITRHGEIRIIEANFNPNLSMFYEMEDKTLYKNILKAKRRK